jgi:acylpyruvate hydrolase
MQLITFRHNGRDSIGALAQDHVVPLTLAYAAHLHRQGAPSHYALAEAELPDDMVRFLAMGERGMEAARRALELVEGEVARHGEARGARGERLLLPMGDLQLLAPIPRPGKVLCIGLNYRDHAEELNMVLPGRPLLFSKYANAVTGPGAPIVLPSITEQVDYEAEFTVVIGKRARRVPEAEAMNHVAGYTAANDVSARDLQFGDGQWVRGKTLDTFAPMGPALVTRDEVPDPHNLRISLRLNGDLMQDSNTRNLVFGVPRLISFLSEAITLEPGDVILTGTPPGVGHNRKPPVYLKPGDTVVVTVDGVGSLENPVVAEQR